MILGRDKRDTWAETGKRAAGVLSAIEAVIAAH